MLFSRKLGAALDVARAYNEYSEGAYRGTRDDVTLHKDFPNDPRFKDQWHLQQIHMMDTWKAAQGDGVIVAVVTRR